MTAPLVVYVTRALPGDALARLPVTRFVVEGAGAPPRDAAALARAASGCHVLVPTYLDRVDEALLARLPSLRLVASYGVGTDHLDLTACHRRGVVVTNTPGVLTEATADLAFALLLATSRRLVEADRFVRARRWASGDPGRLLGGDVFGKRLGLVGLGRIGRAVARRATGFAMDVVYAAPRPVEEAALEGLRVRRLPLDELLATSDFVSLHCPLTDGTRGLLSRDRIACMKRGAILVNTARGPIVDEAALADALASGALGGAGLDVFADEPRVPPSLLALDNVVVAPHVGSGSREARAAMTALVVDEILRFADGAPPLHPV